MSRSIIRWSILLAIATVILAGCATKVQTDTRQQTGGRFVSNGEQIYFTGTNQRGTTITSEMQMGMMGGGMSTCASCHGADGRGGQGRMMMRSFEAPDIRYTMLTAEEMEHEEEEEHPPYTDATIKRAITDGLNPAGEPLEWPMPRWTMSNADLEDLLEYLKSLQ